MKKTIALYAGSFDPVTYGHLDIIFRAKELWGPLVVLVLENGAKKGLFSLAERVDLLKQALADHPDIIVDTAAGLLADYAQKHQLKILVRGIRGGADVESEMAQAHYNRLFNPALETVFLPAREQVQYISSSAVREVARCGGNLDTLVPPCVQRALREKFN